MTRVITASINEDDTITCAKSNGYVGEHNADTLSITLNTEFSDGYGLFYLVFNTCSPGGCFRTNAIIDEKSTPAYISGSTVICPLTEEMTSTGVLNFQLVGYRYTNEKGEEIRKSGIGTVTFAPSIMGSDRELYAQPGFKEKMKIALAQFESFTAGLTENGGELHTHENTPVLEKLGEDDGVLTYSGEKIGTEYVLPTAGTETKGGVKVGPGLKMNGEKLGINYDDFEYLKAYTCALLFCNEKTFTVITGPIESCTCVDENDIGLSESLFSLSDVYDHLFFVPTDSGTFRWMNTDGEIEEKYVSCGNVYCFFVDFDEFTFGVETYQASKLYKNLNTHIHTVEQIKGAVVITALTISPENWSGNVCTVNAANVSENGGVIVQPKPDYVQLWETYGIKCISQGDGKLVFSCETEPEQAIKLSIITEGSADE